MAPTTRAYSKKMKALNITLIKGSQDSEEYKVKNKTHDPHLDFELISETDEDEPTNLSDIEDTANYDKQTLFTTLKLLPICEADDESQIPSPKTKILHAVSLSDIITADVPVKPSSSEDNPRKLSLGTKTLDVVVNALKLIKISDTTIGDRTISDRRISDTTISDRAISDRTISDRISVGSRSLEVVGVAEKVAEVSNKLRSVRKRKNPRRIISDGVVEDSLDTLKVSRLEWFDSDENSLGGNSNSESNYFQNYQSFRYADCNGKVLKNCSDSGYISSSTSEKTEGTLNSFSGSVGNDVNNNSCNRDILNNLNDTSELVEGCENVDKDKDKSILKWAWICASARVENDNNFEVGGSNDLDKVLSYHPVMQNENYNCNKDLKNVNIISATANRIWRPHETNRVTLPETNKPINNQNKVLWRPYEEDNKIDNQQLDSTNICNSKVKKRPYIRKNKKNVIQVINNELIGALDNNLDYPGVKKRPYVRKNNKNIETVSIYNAALNQPLSIWRSERQNHQELKNMSYPQPQNRVPMLPIEHSNLVTTPELLTPPLTPKRNYKKQLLQLHQQQQEEAACQAGEPISTELCKSNSRRMSSSSSSSSSSSNAISRKRTISDWDQDSILARKPQVPPEIFMQEVTKENETVKQRLRRNACEKITLGSKSPHVRDELLDSKRLRIEVPLSITTPPAEMMAIEPLLHSYINTFELISDDESTPSNLSSSSSNVNEKEEKDIEACLNQFNWPAIGSVPCEWIVEKPDPKWTAFTEGMQSKLIDLYTIWYDKLKIERHLPTKPLQNGSLAQTIWELCIVHRYGNEFIDGAAIFQSTAKKLLRQLKKYHYNNEMSSTDGILADLIFYALKNNILIPRIITAYKEWWGFNCNQLMDLRKELIKRYEMHIEELRKIKEYEEREDNDSNDNISKDIAKEAPKNHQVSVIRRTAQVRIEITCGNSQPSEPSANEIKDEQHVVKNVGVTTIIVSDSEEEQELTVTGEKTNSATVVDGYYNMSKFQKHVDCPNTILNSNSNQTRKPRSDSDVLLLPLNLHKPSINNYKESTTNRSKETAPTKELRVRKKSNQHLLEEMVASELEANRRFPLYDTNGHIVVVPEILKQTLMPQQSSTKVQIPRSAYLKECQKRLHGNSGPPFNGMEKFPTSRDFPRATNGHNGINPQTVEDTLRLPIQMRRLSDLVQSPTVAKTPSELYRNNERPLRRDSQNSLGSESIPIIGELVKSPTIAPREKFTYQRQLSQLSNCSSTGSSTADKPATLLPQAYVLEMKRVEGLNIPRDFKHFYEFVTKSQITNGNQPISFNTFLELHNAGNLKTYQNKYWEYVKMKAKN